MNISKVVTKDNIKTFTNSKFVWVYTIVYMSLIHIFAIGLISYGNTDGWNNLNVADIVLSCIGALIMFALIEFVLFLPTIGIMVLSSFFNLVCALSIPIFLFFAGFEYLGATVNILEHGFVKSLLICIFVTPFGIMNLIATKRFYNFMDGE